MGSETPKFPVIDFSKPQELKPGTPEWASLRSQVHKALQEFGCFEAIYGKIRLETRKAMLNAAKEFFDLPFETKLKNKAQSHTQGYNGRHPLAPLFQNVAIDNAHISGNIENLATDMWPHGNPSFSETLKTYTNQQIEFEHIVKRMVIEGLGLEKYMDEYMDSNGYTYRLRLMKYEGTGTSERKVGTPTHTDKNIMTILYQNHVVGLEVKTKDGQWITYEPSSLDSYFVVVGDSLYAMTNGRLYCPPHKVMTGGNEARYSVGLFSAKKAGYIIEAPEELIDEEHPLLFKPFDYGEFLEFFYGDAAGRSETALQLYCGV